MHVRRHGPAANRIPQPRGTFARNIKRAAAAAMLASVITVVGQAWIVDAYVLSGWRWCDNWADIRPNSLYRLEQYPVSNAAFYWNNVYGTYGRVRFDFYYYSTPGSAKIQLTSEPMAMDGTVAKAYWFGWPSCFGSGQVNFNTSYWFYPPTTACQYPYGYYNLETAALHELGHLVGLDHSNSESAVMWPTLPLCFYKGLSDDDRLGIIHIYGPWY